MTTFGYISGYVNDKVNEQSSLEKQLQVALSWNLDLNHIFADKFTNSNKARYNLNNFLANAAEDDILLVPDLTCLYSNARELCCIMQTVADKGIVIRSSDLDYDVNSSIETWIIASQLAHLSYTHYLRQQGIIKQLKKQRYQLHLNIGGRNRRVITVKYKQAYEYLQQHTYAETQVKFQLSKSTLYRIKQQIENKQHRHSNRPAKSYTADRGDDK